MVGRAAFYILTGNKPAAIYNACYLAWEKRVFDVGDNGLYNAYAAILASDAFAI